jgi:hypothetical protein
MNSKSIMILLMIVCAYAFYKGLKSMMYISIALLILFMFFSRNKKRDIKKVGKKLRQLSRD